MSTRTHPELKRGDSALVYVLNLPRRRFRRQRVKQPIPLALVGLRAREMSELRWPES